MIVAWKELYLHWVDFVVQFYSGIIVGLQLNLCRGGMFVADLSTSIVIIDEIEVFLCILAIH